jgi:hypothetical protein
MRVLPPEAGRWRVRHSNDAMSRTRVERFKALVAELLPRIRRLSPHLSEESLLAAAERMAEYRLIDEELGKGTG